MKQSSKKHELGTAALYCRLSRDDKTDLSDVVHIFFRGGLLSHGVLLSQMQNTMRAPRCPLGKANRPARRVLACDL